MIRLLRFLITGSFHEHQYKIIQRISIYDSERPELKNPIYYQYVSRCEECGKIIDSKI